MKEKHNYQVGVVVEKKSFRNSNDLFLPQETRQPKGILNGSIFTRSSGVSRLFYFLVSKKKENNFLRSFWRATAGFRTKQLGGSGEERFFISFDGPTPLVLAGPRICRVSSSSIWLYGLGGLFSKQEKNLPFDLFRLNQNLKRKRWLCCPSIENGKRTDWNENLHLFVCVCVRLNVRKVIKIQSIAIRWYRWKRLSK